MADTNSNPANSPQANTVQIEKRQRRGIIWSKLLVETISVVFGVLLALGLDQWNAARKMAEEALVSQQLILDEISVNLASLRETHAHHEVTLAKFQNALSHIEKMTDDDFDLLYAKSYERGFYREPILSQTSWDIAMATNVIPHMDLDMLHMFNRIYEQQAHYQTLVIDITRNDALLSALADSQSTRLRLITENLNQLWWRERALINAMENGLKAFRPDAELIADPRQ